MQRVDWLKGCRELGVKELRSAGYLSGRVSKSFRKGSIKGFGKGD
jgi:hypothetical protein